MEIGIFLTALSEVYTTEWLQLRQEGSSIEAITTDCPICTYCVGSDIRVGQTAQ